jgi:hypothetical protein
MDRPNSAAVTGTRRCIRWVRGDELAGDVMEAVNASITDSLENIEELVEHIR